MSYHRGGHPGAVAVSYSTSTMAPLSPSRRYSGTSGSSAGSTSSTTGSTASKYASYRTSASNIGSDRPSSYYSSASTNGYRTSSFSSSDSYRRPFVSPARSVSSYESSSIVGSSSGIGLRYGSASSSSASSTTSSTSSSASRERNGLSTPSTTTAAELYALYSPTNYVPNKYGSSSTSNSHRRPSTSSSSSGISSSKLAELHGGDEYDSCRERRDRSYSSETSSGIGLSSNSSNSNLVTPGLAERLSARREAKRRTPVLGSGGTVLAGHAHHDSAPAPTEVTLIADGRNNISTSSVSLVDSSSNRRSTASAVAAKSSNCDIDSTIDIEKFNDIAIENNRDNVKNDNRDVDNNNANNNNNCNENDDDLIIGRESTLDARRRRRRENVVQLENGEQSKGETDVNNDTNNVNNDDLVVIQNNRDNNEDNNCNGKSKILQKNGTSVADKHSDDHHGHSSVADETRIFVNSSPVVTSVVSPTTVLPSSITSFTSETEKSLGNSSVLTTNYCSAFALPQKSKNFDSRNVENVVLEIKEKNLGKISSGKSSVANSGDGGDGSSGGDADRHRTAYTRTKIPTNPDNTELLTNNNAQDREAAVLGIVESSRLVKDSGKEMSTIAANSTSGTGARKSLLWTANNQIDDAFDTGNDIDSTIKTSTTSEDSENLGISSLANGIDKSEDENIFNGISSGLRNGVTERPTGTRGDDPGKPSTSRRTTYGWNDNAIDDLASSTATASSSSSTSNSVPVAVHQNLYRGINDQIDESSNSRPPRNRLQSRRDERYGLNGLRNIGNTCFMNSVIQCLSNTRPLLEYLLQEQHLQDINTTTSSMKGALIKAFGQVIHELWEMSGDHVVNTTALKSQIQRFAPRFMGYSQQDAQEFLRYLLEGLHEDVNRVTVKPQPILTDIPDHYSDSHKAAESWKRYLRSEDSTIVDVFVGQLRSSLHCTSCDHVSVTLDPFWDLSLPIPVRSGTVKLNQCLEHFTKVETLDGDEKPTCSKCQMRRKCTKSFSIQKFPKILVIHLKRFSPTERFRGKLSVLVDFPLTGLDLSAFAAPGVQGCTYNLYGVANHSGTTYSGHYTAYCKHPYSGDWHEYNDNRVSTVPARSVVSSEAYVLFYEQQPLSPHL